MKPIPTLAWPYITAITFAVLAIIASILVPVSSQTPVMTLVGTLAGYVLAKHTT